MKEIRPNQPHPTEELLEKVRGIAYTKSKVSLPYRGEFNRFGVYVQSKDIYDQDINKTIYLAGGKFIPKLIFSDIWREIEYPEGLFDGLDYSDPDYFHKLTQRREDFLSKNKVSMSETIVNKYKPGDWENKLDLLHNFTVKFNEEYIGKAYP